nr:MAG TPA: zinc-ribbon domain protein [Caudoviricetes sp.]
MELRCPRCASRVRRGRSRRRSPRSTRAACE